MPKQFYKHKLLLDENLYHRHDYPKLNEHFNMRHIKLDLNYGGLPDPLIYELAVKQGRIILTTNVKDFRPLLRVDSPGVIGIPEAWSPRRVDTNLTALLMKARPQLLQRTFPFSWCGRSIETSRIKLLSNLELKGRQLPAFLLLPFLKKQPPNYPSFTHDNIFYQE